MTHFCKLVAWTPSFCAAIHYCCVFIRIFKADPFGIFVAATSTTFNSSFAAPTTSSANITNGSNNATAGGVVFTLEQLQREFGLHFSGVTDSPGTYITIPMLSGMANVSNANPPAAHQTPADLSNRSRK